MIDTHLVKLCQLAATCDYDTLLDEMLRDKIVIGVSDNQKRARLLRESKLKLQKALEICRSSEQTTLQVQLIDPSSDSAHYVKHKKDPGEPKMNQHCNYCGSNRPRGKCPAFGKTCPKCDKVGYFPQVCKSSPGKKPSERGKAQSKKPQKQKVHQVTDYNSDDSIHIVQESREGVQYFTLTRQDYVVAVPTGL